MTQQDTICAIATAQGGAIGTIRVSGPEAIALTSRIFTPFHGAPLTERKAYTLTFGRILAPVVFTENEQAEYRQAETAQAENEQAEAAQAENKQTEYRHTETAYTETIQAAATPTEVIDEVLVAVFRAPHSYTGEDSTEISCHGSSYILQRVLQLLIQQGCRSALPGEFTQRAFLNGKMDLSQAEAVADLIASSSAATHRLAMSQMRGGFSHELKGLRDQLLHITSLMELELDFSDHEELEFANRDELSALADQIEQTIARLAHSFNVGNAIKNGIPVAIIGETNAGKSTLLNALLNEEKAIVSDIHGTTRDVIEDTINLRGITFRFIDTAGIRQTTDTIESLGIERTYQKMEQADLILWMVDATDVFGIAEGKETSNTSRTADEKKTSDFSELEELKRTILPHCAGKRLILLFNKCDRLNVEAQTALKETFADVEADKLFISAKQRQNLEALETKLVEAAALPEISQNDVIVTNVRHYEALTRALDSIHRVQEGLQMGLSGDLVSEDLRQCIFHLSDIAGEVTTDQVLANIFKNFCIGK